MFDYHVHTSISADSTMPMKTACQHAIEKGIKEIAFTEHLDYYYPNCPLDFTFSYDEYASTVDEARRTFGDKLTILKAVEIGLHPSTYEQTKVFTTNNVFDFVIGSVHIVDDLDLHNGDYFKGKQIDEAIRRYYETVNAYVRDYEHFNVLGHLDLIKRYVHHLNYKVSDIKWRQYDDIIEDTLKVLTESGRGIEINMSGYRYKIDCSLPDAAVIKRYKELGGEIITIGSDAHHQAHLAHEFDQGYHLLQETGFRYISQFREQQPTFVKIEDVLK